MDAELKLEESKIEIKTPRVRVEEKKRKVKNIHGERDKQNKKS